MSDIKEFLQEKKVKFSIYKDEKTTLVLKFGVFAKPGSKVEKIVVSEDGSLTIFTRKKPVEGEANNAICEALSDLFGISKSMVELEKGQKSRHKQVLVQINFTKDKDMSYYCEKLLKNLS